MSTPLTKRQREALAAHSHRLGLPAIALAAVMWAVAANVARSLFDDGVPPVELAASRAWIALLGLGLLRPWRYSPARPLSHPRLVGLGLAIALVNAVYYIAIQRLDVAVAIVLEFTAPALVVLWVAFTTRTRPAPEVMAAVVAAVIGVALLSEITSVDMSDLDGFGLLMGISSAFFFAAYTLLSEQANERYGAVGAMFRAFAITATFWVVAQAFRGWPQELVDPSNLPRVLYVGILGTIIPFLLYVWGIGHVRSERASITATLEPAVAGLIAWIWLDQALAPVQITGAALVIGAVIALQIRRKEQVIAPEP